MSSIFSLTTLAETLRIAAPYACAAVGGIWAERSGILQVGLEGVLLSSAFASVAFAHATGSAFWGLAGGIFTGAILSIAHALLVERARVHAVISGIALNLFAFGATRMLLQGFFGSPSSSPSIEGFRIGPAGSSGEAVLARVLLDPVTVAAILAAALTPFVLARTRFGLRVRACGENPQAAASVGLRVTRIRVAALAISGAICALGGVHLAFNQHRFESGMSNGRGFMALAVVVVAGGRTGYGVLACLALGALEALHVVLQRSLGQSFGGELVKLLPYVATLVALAFAAGRTAAPQGLGKSAEE
ncbi:MAG: ABC transporter permease [Polyangiaceae bacterium]|nr:ABC transporter permease [Polyangiaceae bacterium]